VKLCDLPDHPFWRDLEFLVTEIEKPEINRRR